MRSQSKPEFQQDLVGLLGESRRGPGLRRGDVELHRVGDQFEFARLHEVLVGPDLASSAACRVSCTGAHGPASVANRSLHSASGRLAIASVRISTAVRGVLGDRLDGGEPRIVGEFVEVHVPAHVGPELGGLHHHEGDVAVVGGRVHADQRVDRRAVHAGRRRHHPLTEVLGQRDRVPHRPQAAAQQRHVDDRRFAGALALEQRGRDAAREVGAGDGVAVGRPGRADHALACPAG